MHLQEIAEMKTKALQELLKQRLATSKGEAQEPAEEPRRALQDDEQSSTSTLALGNVALGNVATLALGNVATSSGAALKRPRRSQH